MKATKKLSDPETGKTGWRPDFLFTPSETPYTRRIMRMNWSIDNGITFTSAPYLRTKLPDPYGYLENHYDIYPCKGANSSLEISGQMTDSYHAQARIWSARGRKCNRWVWQNSPHHENAVYELRGLIAERIDTGYVKKPKGILIAEARFRDLFAHIQVLTLPRERTQLLTIPIEDELELVQPISLERAAFHKPRLWYYGVQTK